MNEPLPVIGVVIIGINVSAYLAGCIASVRAAHYPQERIDIVYVDGGSVDESVRVAHAFDGVQVVELNDPHPTPGRGRNNGWKRLSSPLIQFMDADTILHPDWFKEAVPMIEGRCAAVCGHRREQYPEKNIYHVLTEMEWHYEVGPCRYFGGEVLMKRSVLEATGGFDETLVAGEDPELSYRIRQAGWEIHRLDEAMTRHDINMSTFRQYLKRAYRSGYAYAEIGIRFVRNKEKLWLRELIRVSVKATLPFILVFGGVLAGWVHVGIVLGLLILFRPMLRLRRLKKNFEQSWKYTIAYAFHTALVVFPQFGGVLRFILGKALGKPLQNQGRAGIDRSQVSA